MLLLYTAPDGTEDLEVCYLWYLFRLVLAVLAVYQSVHPLIYCIHHQRDRGEKVSAVKKCLGCLVEVAVVRSLSLGTYFTARRRRRSPFSQGPPFAHPHGRDAGTGLLEVGRPLLLFCPECLCCAIIGIIRLLACLLD